MEALAALSLACNVFQLVEIGLKVGRSVKEVYQQGSSADHHDLRLDCIRLNELADNVKSSQVPTDHLSVNADDATLRAIAADSVHITEQLQNELNKLIASGGITSSVKVVFRTHRKKDTIDKLVQRLEMYQRRLDTQLLVSVRNRVNGLIHDQNVAFEMLDGRSREFLNLLNTRFTQLGNIVDASAAETRTTIVDHIDTKIDSSHVQSSLVLSRELDIRRKEQQEVESRRDLEDRLQKSFWYPGIRERVTLIDTSDKKQYSWLFDTRAHHLRVRKIQQTWSSISDWLISDDSLYWIQGKPGSGKSTLMKMLWQSFDTEWLLSEGSAKPDDLHPDRQRYKNKQLSRTPCILTHSFWLSAPNDMQRSFKGLLHSLLYQLTLDRADVVIANITRQSHMTRKSILLEWQLTELSDLLFAVLTQLSQSCPVCLFLDGLDEIQSSEDRSRMITFLDSCAGVRKLKTCVSSRFDYPWIDYFVEAPQLRLHDLTRSDINEFVETTLDRAWGGEDTLDAEDKRQRDRLVDDVTSRAEGVFLWVHLALRSLLDSSRHATWSEKRERLDSLPEGIIDLYLDMLSRRGHDPKSTKIEAATYLKLCLEYQTSEAKSSFPTGAFLHHCVVLRARHFSGRASLEYSSSYNSFRKQYTQLHERIQQICAGMIRLVSTCFLSESDLEAASRNHIDTAMVTEPLNDLTGQGSALEDESSRLRAMHAFLHHRTVSDFLVDTPSGQDFLQSCVLTPLEIFSAYVEAELVRTRLQIAVCDATFISRLLGRISRYETNTDTASQVEIAKLVRNIYNTILEQHLRSRDQSMNSQESTEQKVYQLFIDFTDAAAKQDGVGYGSRNPFSLATDMQSLSLLHGISSCFMVHVAPLLRSSEKTELALSQAYKDYILLCAIRGGLDKVALLLLEHGANMYADMFPPGKVSWKTCAATEVLLHLSAESRLQDEWKARMSQHSRKQDISKWRSVVQQAGHSTSYMLVASGNNLVGEGQSNDKVLKGLNYITRFRPMNRNLKSDVYFLVDLEAHLQWLMNRTEQHRTLQSGYLQAAPSAPRRVIGVALLPESCMLDQQIIPYPSRSIFGYNSVESQAPKDEFNVYASYQSCPFCLVREGDELWTNLTRRLGFPAEPILKSESHWAVCDTLNARNYFYRSECFSQPHGPCSVTSGIGRSKEKQSRVLNPGPGRIYNLSQADEPPTDAERRDGADNVGSTLQQEIVERSDHDEYPNSGNESLELLIRRIHELSRASATATRRTRRLIVPGGRRKQGVRTWIVEGANSWIDEVGRELGLLKDSSDPEVMQGPIPMFATPEEISTITQNDSSLDDAGISISPVSRASTTFFDAEE